MCGDERGSRAAVSAERVIFLPRVMVSPRGTTVAIMKQDGVGVSTVCQIVTIERGQDAGLARGSEGISDNLRLKMRSRLLLGALLGISVLGAGAGCGDDVFVHAMSSRHPCTGPDEGLQFVCRIGCILVAPTPHGPRWVRHIGPAVQANGYVRRCGRETESSLDGPWFSDDVFSIKTDSRSDMPSRKRG